MNIWSLAGSVAALVVALATVANLFYQRRQVNLLEHDLNTRLNSLQDIVRRIEAEKTAREAAHSLWASSTQRLEASLTGVSNQAHEAATNLDLYSLIVSDKRTLTAMVDHKDSLTTLDPSLWAGVVTRTTAQSLTRALGVLANITPLLLRLHLDQSEQLLVMLTSKYLGDSHKCLCWVIDHASNATEEAQVMADDMQASWTALRTHAQSRLDDAETPSVPDGGAA